MDSRRETNDIITALRRKIDRLTTQRKLSPKPPHEFTPLDLEIQRTKDHFKAAVSWASRFEVVKEVRNF